MKFLTCCARLVSRYSSLPGPNLHGFLSSRLTTQFAHTPPIRTDKTSISCCARFSTTCSQNSSSSSSKDNNSISTEDHIDREVQRYDYEEFTDEYVEDTVEVVETKLPISLERGQHGVYDIEELVTLLKAENAKDLCVIRVLPEIKYVDQMVIVTGRSTRHIASMAAQIKWVYKHKRGKKDPKTVKIEGRQTNDWMAIDLGNIAVHLFLESSRQYYDLESLWTVGPQFDQKTKEQNTEQTYALDNFFFDAVLFESGNTSNKDKSEIPLDKSMENVAGWHAMDKSDGKST